MIAPRKHTHCTPQEDAILIQMVEKIGEKRWPLIAAKLPGRTGKGCSHRWRTYLRPDVKHPHLEPFSEWEAAVIVMGQREHANNWLCEPFVLASPLPRLPAVCCRRFPPASLRRRALVYARPPPIKTAT